MSAFNELAFRSLVSEALGSVRTILENERNPQLAAEVPHQYNDKYILAESAINTAIGAVLNALEVIGLNDVRLANLKAAAATRSVSLRFRRNDTCTFLRKVEREVESPTSHVTAYNTGVTVKHTVVTKVTDYFYNFSSNAELIAYQGNEPERPLAVLTSRQAQCELKTSTDRLPYPSNSVRSPIDLNITWLLQHINDQRQATFAINRNLETCRTPRRNTDISTAIQFLAGDMVRFSEAVRASLHEWFRIDPKSASQDTSALLTNDVFVPVLPLLEDKKGSSLSSSSSSSSASASFALDVKSAPNSGAFPADLANRCLIEQRRSLNEKMQTLQKTYPSADVHSLMTQWETRLVVIFNHIPQVTTMANKCVDYMEHLLYTQLIAAIGKIVSSKDFYEYSLFHARQLYTKAYRPLPFAYAVRRPNHTPDGVLSIETNSNDPIFTFVKQSKATAPFYFTLDAATKVAFTGNHYLHGWLNQDFASSGSSIQLAARTRQFSSFIVLLGRITGANTFDPKYSFLIRDKDEVSIPLNLETIPTIKEFKKAVSSLSPEMQRFATGFRSMQLESTLFAVCVIQVKPQLEKLLNLPDDSLTKEIALTQDLMTLFIEHQIPSDLLSFKEGSLVPPKTTILPSSLSSSSSSSSSSASSSSASTLSAASPSKVAETTEEKVAVVRASVDKILAIIQKIKDEELKQSQQASAYRIASSPRNSVVPYDADPFSDLCAPTAVSCEALCDFAEDSCGAVPQSIVRCDSASAASDLFDALVPPPPPPSAPAPPPPSAPAPAPAPAPPSDPTPAPAPAADNKQEAKKPEDRQQEQSQTSTEAGVDYTTIPQQLEQRAEKLDLDSALRPTIITPDTVWSKRSKKSLLADMTSSTLANDEQEKERNRAFDLLDALTKSGDLSIECADLHVVIASTHCFKKNVIDTVVQDNINPIEKIERSSMIIASTVHGIAPSKLLTESQLPRIAQFNGNMLEPDADPNFGKNALQQNSKVVAK